MKPSQQSISGTSFHGTTINATVNQLISICGEPCCIDNTGEDKVNFEWQMELDNGDVFTIYDWKEYRVIGLDEVINWHIGGRNETTTNQACDELLNMLTTMSAPPALSYEELNEMLQDEYERNLNMDEGAE
jgi:hypothetical protein